MFLVVVLHHLEVGGVDVLLVGVGMQEAEGMVVDQNLPLEVPVKNHQLAQSQAPLTMNLGYQEYV